jgi:hypothetical protein
MSAVGSRRRARLWQGAALALAAALTAALIRTTSVARPQLVLTWG